MTRALVAASLVGSANAALPTGSGFGAAESTLPQINVRYRYPATDASAIAGAVEGQMAMESRLDAIAADRAYYPSSFIQKAGQADIQDALDAAPVVKYAAGDEAMRQMMLGMLHAPRPRRSFLSQGFDPAEMVPPGVTGAMAGSVMDSTPYTLVLQPPSETASVAEGLVGSLARVETAHEHALEGSAIAAKQRLLANEIAKVHQMVAKSRRSFLGYDSMVRKPDAEIVLHAPSESPADIQAAVNEAGRTASSIASSAASADAAMKQALLQAEIAKIARIVKGH